MSSKKQISSVDEEDDYLESIFLGIEKLPFPKKEIADYESLVLEIMKSGCNRQIAEYAMIKYKGIEDSNKEEKKLPELERTYNDAKKVIFDQIKNKENIKDILSSKIKNYNQLKKKKDELNNYDYEIEELLDFYRNELKENKDADNKMKEIEKAVKDYLYEILIEKKESEETKKFLDERKIYMDKKEAVIESALRKVKKIVNDKKEYEIFYKEYFGKDEEKEIEFK